MIGEDRHAASGALDARWLPEGSNSEGVASPMVLGPNRLRRFYAGGPRIDALRGDPTVVGAPEDWVGSTTTSFEDPAEGLSRLPDGRVLRTAIESDPIAFLGENHVARWGANPGLLIKLLDAGERLPVHFHPGRRFAREQLAMDFGKTEAWIVLAAERDAVMHIGFNRPVSRPAVARWVTEQNIAAMLSAMHEVPVRAGQVFLVPAGTAHAIGAGILVVELQEPTDLSALLEWERFGVKSGVANLRLGWQRVLTALDLNATPLERVLLDDVHASTTTPVHNLFPDTVAPYFRAQRITATGAPVHLEPSFAILIVTEGSLALRSEHGEPIDLTRGATALVPHAAGSTSYHGDATVIRCLPPAVESGAGQW